ncbi:hypothetical protein HPP92_026000 [Vanilla planifolia]|uniref:Uncharacterized protein n=1 Tax=Vanilla planifolia TaxID=51239 RepID=A0A835PGD9_VANPL|nr:hypothetical protein HPP92_026000 [Vanilla planifolia]
MAQERSSSEHVVRKEGENLSGGRRRQAGKQNYSFARRCRLLATEQRAKFYILRRCIALLLCSKENGEP